MYQLAQGFEVSETGVTDPGSIQVEPLEFGESRETPQTIVADGCLLQRQVRQSLETGEQVEILIRNLRAAEIHFDDLSCPFEDSPAKSPEFGNLALLRLRSRGSAKSEHQGAFDHDQASDHPCHEVPFPQV
jgi:hypothetical protein